MTDAVTEAMDDSTDADAVRRPGRRLDPDKRRAILDAAQSVFLASGFEGASMDEVARIAGVGKMTVYRHFGAKDALYEAMLREVCGAMVPMAEVPHGASLAEEARILADAFVALVTEGFRLSTYRLAMAEGERSGAMPRLFYHGAVLPLVEHVAKRLRAHAPVLDPLHARDLAGMFLQMVQGPAMLRLLMGIDAAPDEAAFARQRRMAIAFLEHEVAAAAR